MHINGFYVGDYVTFNSDGQRFKDVIDDQHPVILQIVNIDPVTHQNSVMVQIVDEDLWDIEYNAAYLAYYQKDTGTFWCHTDYLEHSDFIPNPEVDFSKAFSEMY